MYLSATTELQVIDEVRLIQDSRADSLLIVGPGPGAASQRHTNGLIIDPSARQDRVGSVVASALEII